MPLSPPATGEPPVLPLPAPPLEGVAFDAAALLPRLAGTGLRDAARLRRRVEDLAAGADRDPARLAAAFLSLAGDVDAAERRLERRAASRPRTSYPDLPVSARREEILAALAAHQVVVVAGETGSGKTTQLPKMLLDAGKGVRGTIGHTQPRRIAARAVAERLAEELGVGLGGAVGYTVRFTDTASERTLVRVMTDGVLLAEIADDPLLLRYDALVVDEAHERSLTIDTLLGYLTRLLPQRPDLSVVVTSATIDPQRFADHFGGAPVVEVSGRTYPVEVRYRPFGVAEADAEDADDAPDAVPGAVHGGVAGTAAPGGTGEAADERDQPEAIADAVAELLAEGPGDVLVFCSGEREIREAADALAERGRADRRFAALEVVPLYARLSAAEQHRVFAAHDGTRVVVATNVAETSLTVPGIRYVVDTGTARISRYSRRTKVQRLPVEPVSQASARQRAGRCGRVADGICIRLYAESDFESRPAFTEPEILRTNLASVVLRMAALDVGPVEDFPFVDPPDRRAVRDAVDLLEELHAVVPSRRERGAPAVAPELTDVGRTLSRLPVDPRMARMLVEARGLGCLDEMVVLAAALSIVDVRERPREAPGPADTAHRRFARPDSDLLTLLALWRHLEDRRRALSGNAFRRLCREEFLNHRRVREWADLVSQLRQVTAELGWDRSDVGLAGDAATLGPRQGPDTRGEGDDEAAAERVHRAALSGLLSHVGVRLDVTGADGAGTRERREGRGDRRGERRGEDYLGARNARFAVAPGSALGSRRPRWVMAAELVETARLYARTLAAVQPSWIEEAAGDLAVRTHGEPRWDRRRAQVTALERVTLYGLPLVAGRSVAYGGIDPVAARETFLRRALVEGEWDTHHAFVRDNRRALDEAREQEERTRRALVVAGDDDLYGFFDARVPEGVVSGAHFDRWWRGARAEDPGLLTLDVAWLLRPGAAGPPDAATAFPDSWADPGSGLDLPLSYRFAPGTPEDGVTVEVPLRVLHRVDGRALGWLVPGLRQELVTELVRGLPKALRRSFAPAADHAAEVLRRLGERGAVGRDDLSEAVAGGLSSMGGTAVAPGDLRPGGLPPHLRMRVRVAGEDGAPLAEGRDLAAMQRDLAGRQRDALAGLAAGYERRGLREWPDGDVPATLELEAPGGGAPVVVHPALVDEGATAGVRVLADAAVAAREHRAGVVRLLALGVASPVREVVAALPVADKLALAAPPGQDTASLLADCVRAGVADLLAGYEAGSGTPRTRAGFDAARTVVAGGLAPAVRDVVALVVRVLGAAAEVARVLDGLRPPADPKRAAALREGADDLRAHLSRLLAPGWVSREGAAGLPDLVRWLAAARRRADDLAADPLRDAARLGTWRAAAALLAEAEAVAAAAAPAERARLEPLLASVARMLEEYRVAVFAQGVRTAHPVSEQRIRKALAPVWR